jgi:cyclase
MHMFPFPGFSAAVPALTGTPVAQGPSQRGRPGPQAGLLKVHRLMPSIYWAEGGVGNCGFIIGNKGVIVIDTTVSPAGGKELLVHAAKITPKPVTTVILTHGDSDHIGGLAAFPTGLTIIAQKNNKKNMEVAVATGGQMVSANHLPNRAVTKNREAVEIEGVKLELLHWAPAHTAGDLVVYFPETKVVFTGDIFCMDQPIAMIHREQKGNSEGWIMSAKGVIALNADRFVVGHGDVQIKGGLQKRIGAAEVEREKIMELVAKGFSLPQIQAAVGDPPTGQGKPGPSGPRFTPFSEVVYRELTERNP